MYNKKVMQCFRNPKNYGKIENADGVGKVGNKSCGDVMFLYIKVKKEKGKEIIKDIKWETMGCVAAMATSSEVTSLAKGKTLEEARKIKNADVAKDLNLPAVKLHCSNLAADALQAAIKDYESKKV
ncbi:MAG TPA: iron-sulfur cluster assembly scaffold protein, partial [Candidatus Nanoarchaeia archaeon]|nr:iron-sulfur cluster assembly scaffold protein [Candidatus Nanoarchaeia archaeon]